MAISQAVKKLRGTDPLNNLDRQVIADYMEDLQAVCKERGEKLGRLRDRIEAEEAKNFILEDALKTALAHLDRGHDIPAMKLIRKTLTENGG